MGGYPPFLGNPHQGKTPRYMAPPKIPLIPPIGTLVVVLRTVPTRGALRKRTGRVQCAPYVEDVKAVINSIYIYIHILFVI